MTVTPLFPLRSTGAAVAPGGSGNQLETPALVPPPLHGDSIRRAPPYPVVEPTGLFLIYFTTDDDGTPRALHIYDPAITDIATAERELYAIAKHGGPNVGKDFENLRWEYPTHVSIALDVDDHEFYWRDPEGYDPIIFLAEKERDETETTARAFNYDPNYSFYNAARATLTDPVSGKIRPVLRFTNYHKKNAQGDDFAPGERAAYCMNIQVLVRYRSGRVWKHIIDPDSENQGPGG